jgi:repressor LexA
VYVPLRPTVRQQEIAEFLEGEFRRRGLMPTQQEIATRFGFASRNSVRTHLRLMARKGMVTLLPGKARGLKLTLSVSTGIPVIGRIAAGPPREAHEDDEEILPISPQLFAGTELFALRVKGDSMRDAGILPGDIAVLNRQQDVGEGEIAAVLLEDDATLKFVHRRNGAVVLRGANPDFPDIIIRGDDSRSLRFLGKYVGLIRRQGGSV